PAHRHVVFPLSFPLLSSTSSYPCVACLPPSPPRLPPSPPPPPTAPSTLSLHDALPSSAISPSVGFEAGAMSSRCVPAGTHRLLIDRKSTRLNSSHVSTSYAAFCLKKKTSCTGNQSDADTRNGERKGPHRRINLASRPPR